MLDLEGDSDLVGASLLKGEGGALHGLDGGGVIEGVDDVTLRAGLEHDAHLLDDDTTGIISGCVIALPSFFVCLFLFRVRQQRKSKSKEEEETERSKSFFFFSLSLLFLCGCRGFFFLFREIALRQGRENGAGRGEEEGKQTGNVSEGSEKGLLVLDKTLIFGVHLLDGAHVDLGGHLVRARVVGC